MGRHLPWFVMLLLTGCAGSPNKPASDEEHRPVDWSTHLTLQMDRDTVDDGMEKLAVVDASFTGSFEELIDQVFQLTFSGDAQVFASDLFGEMDRERPLDPDDLLKELQHFDTISVEDLVTGELVDTVIDLSFSQSEVSAVTVFMKCSLDESDALQMQPYALAIGKKVYDDAGTFRGVSQQFYLRLNHEEDATNNPVYQRLNILSDSLGLFAPAYFDYHSASGTPQFQSLLEQAGAAQDSVLHLEFDFQFSYRGQSLTCDEIVVGKAKET